MSLSGAAAQTVREAPQPKYRQQSESPSLAALLREAAEDADAKTADRSELLPPPAHETPQLEEAEAESTSPSGRSQEPSWDEQRLTLADVIASLYRAYPEVVQARQEFQRTAGESLAAYGAFDTKLEAESIAEPTGYYENYRHGIGVARQTWWGGYLSAGYRIGRGTFQPWYKELETDKAGEFKVGMALPLLQGRAIDPRRLEVFQASLAQRAAEPQVQQAILEASRDAAEAYWDWVAIGGILQAQRELLVLAEQRGQQYAEGVRAGRFAEIDLLLNQQLIAERRAKLLETEQKFRATAFKLSLFLRGEQGEPIVPRNDWLPTRFPVVQPPPPGNFQNDLADALRRRPEPRLLQLQWQQLALERRLARNELLPRLDVIAEASQDVGPPGTKDDDKDQFRLILGVEGEVPIQRRKARGKITSTSAKLVQVQQKLRLQQDKIAAELQTAYNALVLAAQVVDQAEASLRAAMESLERYRFAFERGQIDLIYLNLLEMKANETEIKLVEAQRDWFAALVAMQSALGIDPLDQAVAVSSLPPSPRPGPGHLPQVEPMASEELDRDWQLHTAPPGAPNDP